MKVISVILGVFLILCAFVWLFFDFTYLPRPKVHTLPEEIFIYGGGGILIVGAFLLVWGLRKR